MTLENQYEFPDSLPLEAAQKQNADFWYCAVKSEHMPVCLVLLSEWVVPSSHFIEFIKQTIDTIANL